MGGFSNQKGKSPSPKNKQLFAAPRDTPRKRVSPSPPSPPKDLAVFSSVIPRVLKCIKPSTEDMALRDNLVKKFKEWITEHDQLRDCVFEAYGSYATELYTRYGDIDLSVQHRKHRNEEILYRIYQAIIRDKEGSFSDVEYVVNSKPEVLRFNFGVMGNDKIPFDLTADEKSAKNTVSLLKEIKKSDYRFRDLVLLVKGWARCHNINDASSGGLKSYALYVLIIYHLQTTQPPILPPFNKLCTDQLMKNLRGGRSWIGMFRENLERSKCSDNTQSIPELFYQFIQKFINVSQKAKDCYVSIKEGKWVRKDRAMKKSFKPFWIEEPLSKENLARSINDLKRIEDAFKTTYEKICRGGMSEIVKNLVSQELRELVSKTERDTTLPEKGSAPISLSAPAIDTGGRDTMSPAVSDVHVSSSALDIIKKKLQDSTTPATSSHTAPTGPISSALDIKKKLQDSTTPATSSHTAPTGPISSELNASAPVEHGNVNSISHPLGLGIYLDKDDDDVLGLLAEYAEEKDDSYGDKNDNKYLGLLAEYAEEKDDSYGDKNDNKYHGEVKTGLGKIMYTEEEDKNDYKEKLKGLGSEKRANKNELNDDKHVRETKRLDRSWATSRPSKRRRVSRPPYFSFGKVDIGDDPKAPRNRNHHKSDRYRKWDSKSAYQPKSEGLCRRDGRESEGSWQNKDLYLHAERTRDVNSWKREYVLSRMSRYPHKDNEHERSERDRYYSKKEHRESTKKGEREENSIQQSERVERGGQNHHNRQSSRINREDVLSDDEDSKREAGNSWKREYVLSRMSRYPHKDNEHERSERDRYYSKKEHRESTKKGEREENSIQQSERVERGGQNHHNRQSSRINREDVLSDDEDSKREAGNSWKREYVLSRMSRYPHKDNEHERSERDRYYSKKEHRESTKKGERDVSHSHEENSIQQSERVERGGQNHHNRQSSRKNREDVLSDDEDSKREAGN